MFWEKHLLEYSSSKSMHHQTIVVKFHQINNMSVTHIGAAVFFLTAATLGMMVKMLHRSEFSYQHLFPNNILVQLT